MGRNEDCALVNGNPQGMRGENEDRARDTAEFELEIQGLIFRSAAPVDDDDEYADKRRSKEDGDV